MWRRRIIHFDPKVTVELIAYKIVCHKHPLCYIEHKGFRKVLSYLNPLWNNISYRIVKSDIIGLHELKRANILSFMDGNKGKVVITIDIWTWSFQTKGYMGIRAHFIDDYWTLQVKLSSKMFNLKFMRVLVIYYLLYWINLKLIIFFTM